MKETIMEILLLVGIFTSGIFVGYIHGQNETLVKCEQMYSVEIKRLQSWNDKLLTSHTYQRGR